MVSAVQHLYFVNLLQLWDDGQVCGQRVAAQDGASVLTVVPLHKETAKASMPSGRGGGLPQFCHLPFHCSPLTCHARAYISAHFPPIF